MTMRRQWCTSIVPASRNIKDLKTSGELRELSYRIRAKPAFLEDADVERDAAAHGLEIAHDGFEMVHGVKRLFHLVALGGNPRKGRTLPVEVKRNPRFPHTVDR